MKKLLLAMLIFSIPLAGAAYASNCRARVVVATPAVVVATPVVAVVTPVVATVATFVPLIQVPLYSSGFYPAPAPAAAAPCANTQLDARLRRIEEALERGIRPSETPKGFTPKTSTMPPASEPGPSAMNTVFQNRCASCHDAPIATSKGAGIVLTSGGNLAPISDKIAVKILVALQTGTMPKTGPKLTDEEFETSVLGVSNLVSRSSP